jgi:O-antigen ligase/polysaccharide polymerase Wzy-like membrane protein
MAMANGPPRDLLLGVPVAIGSAGIGAVSAANPVAGAALGAITVAACLPWAALFVALGVAALGNRWGLEVGGVTIRAAQLLLIPFAFRTFTVSRWQERPRWVVPEWLLIGYISLQFVTSYANADIRRASLEDALILAGGATMYLLAYTALATPARLRVAVRVILALSAIGALAGIGALLLYFAAGWSGGVELRQVRVFGGAPPVRGLAFEHDLFGSTCAAGAVAFLTLLRQGHLLFRRTTLRAGLAICMLGTLVSQARAAYVGLAVCGLVLYVVFPRHRRVGVPRVASVLVVGAVAGAGSLWALQASTTDASAGGAALPAIGSAVGYQIGQSLNLSSGTGGQRLAKYRQAFDELLDTAIPGPLLGRGTNSWGQRHFHPGPFQSFVPAYLESLYMRSLYDSGFLGLALIVGFFLLLVWPARAVLTAPGEVGSLARALTLASMVLAIAYAATDSTLLIWPWIVFGLTRAARYLATARPPAGGREVLPAA